MASRGAQSLFRRVCKANLAFRPPPQARHFISFSHSPKYAGILAQIPRRPASFWSLASRQTPLESLKLSTRPSPGYFSSNSTAPTESALPTLSPPSVGYWLLFSSALVYGIIVVGGYTRLTESGLSVTEWKPVSGVLPPMNAAEWEEEFDKYKATPEFRLINHQITLENFKRLWLTEYAHRVLGRLIGVTFVLPFAYFFASKRLTARLPNKLASFTVLIGLQGLLGWYMVKSGLEESEKPGTVPRVSQYRLAAHLGTAIFLYTGMLSAGMTVLADWKFSQKGTWNGIRGDGWEKVLNDPRIQRFKKRVWLLIGLTFLTVMSGAFVAGLDAGLVYNEFPLMGGRLAPPRDELFSRDYAKRADGLDLWWRNILENPTTVQFDHRILATTTYLSTTVLFLSGSLRPELRALIPSFSRKLLVGVFAAANVQVLLGISTLLYLVPTPLAVSHQAGGIALLSFLIALATSLRRPGNVARVWREASRKSASASASSTH